MIIKNEFDVVVVGGGTAGVSCAYNLGIRGLSVLLIEKNTFLGGSITSSLVIPAMKTSNNSINNDFFEVLYKKLNSMLGAITYSDGNKGWFNPELTKIALDELMKDANVHVLFESNIYKIEEDNNKILSIYVDTIDNNKITLRDDKVLSQPIVAKYYVDATGDANFCEKINCELLENNLENSQPINLRFIMSGINSKVFAEWLLEYDSNRDVTTCTVIDDEYYVSTAYTWDSNIEWALKPLVERAIAENVVTAEDMNYFQLFSIARTPDSIAFNAPRILDSSITRSEAYLAGRQAIYRISSFCQKYLPGFEKAYISNIASSLGVRVSNRVKGKYIYTIDDLLSCKTFDNPVVRSNYPVDIHSNKKNNSVLKKVEKEYELPIESLFVDKYENLFVIGRCISADFKAQAALRIIPSCFSMGEGLAKYLANELK